jgi:hypothetical protein
LSTYCPELETDTSKNNSRGQGRMDTHSALKVGFCPPEPDGHSFQRKALGSEHPVTVKSVHTLARAYRAANKFARAEAFLQQTLDIQLRVQGPESFEPLASAINLSETYTIEGKYRQAEALLRSLSVSAFAGNLLEQSLIPHGPVAEQRYGLSELVAGWSEAVVNMRRDNWMNQSVKQSASLQLP